MQETGKGSSQKPASGAAGSADQSQDANIQCEFYVMGGPNSGRDEVVGRFLNVATDSIASISSGHREIEIDEQKIQLKVTRVVDRQRYGSQNLPQPNFGSIDVYLLVFDRADRKAFKANVSGYSEIFITSSKVGAYIFLVANSTIDDKNTRGITDQEIKAAVDEYSFNGCFSINTATGNGIEELFKESARRFLQLNNPSQSEHKSRSSRCSMM